MEGLARKTDPQTSHAAARQLHDDGHMSSQSAEARRLVVKNPGMTYRELYRIHQAQSEKAGIDPMFTEPVSLMRRLSGEKGVAFSMGDKRCSVTNRKASKWWPK